MAKSSSPRLAGFRVRLAAQLLRSGIGQPLRRSFAKQLFVDPLASVDVGDAPPYQPRPWKK